MTLAEANPRSKISHLTLPPRQEETLSLLLLGASEKEVANVLGVSKSTVHVYVKSLYKRFSVNSRGELFARWMMLNNLRVPVPARVAWKQAAENAIQSRMSRGRTSQPTELELKVLNVLWQRDTASVAEMFSDLAPTKIGLLRQTLDKLIPVMIKKGLIQALPESRPQRYRALIAQIEAQNSIVQDLVHRVFHGSAAKLIMRALSMKKSTPEELQEIRRLLDENSTKK